MKRFFTVLVALAVVLSFAATAFAGTTVDFETEGSSSIIINDDYELNLQDVTIEESAEQAHSGTKSVKVSFRPDAEKVVDGKAYFSLNLRSSDENSPMSKITETDVVNFFYYLPEDSNISEISLYISDEIDWDYNGVGKIEPDNTDEWLDYSEEIDFVRFDEDTRGASQMPCLLILECHLLDVDEGGYFYLDDFYFGPEEEAGQPNSSEPTQAPADDATAAPADDSNATQAPAENATQAPSNNAGSSDDSSLWIIIGCVAAAVVALVAAFVVISKKKK